MAACSGVHVVAGAVGAAGNTVVGVADWSGPLCWASAGVAAVVVSKARINRVMLRLRRAGGR